MKSILLFRLRLQFLYWRFGRCKFISSALAYKKNSLKRSYSMRLAVFLLLISSSAWAAPDRQFMCKFTDLEERAAFFVSLTPDGSILKSIRYQGSESEDYELSKVIQFRYGRDSAGRENFFALYNGDDRTGPFFLEFSGNTNMPGKYGQVLLDPKQEKEFEVVFELNLSCNRLL